MSNAGGVEETQKSLEKQLEEMREQLQKEKEEGRLKDEELKKKDDELQKEREERLAEKMELQKFRRQTPGKIGCVDEGSKKWEVEVAKICEKDLYSDYTYIVGVPFRIECNTKTAVYLFCNDKALTKTYYAKVAFTLTLASTVNPHSRTTHHIYTSAFGGHGWDGFITWTDLVDPSKGYIKDGRITIESQIKLICFYKNAFTDPSSPDLKLTDVTLVVGGKEFNVCKKHIAIYSDFFKTLFLSDFAEKGKTRLELPEVDAKEFEDLLRNIHPQRRTTITKDNIEYLLRLADYFIVDAVRWQCIDFLKDTTSFPPAAKLQITEQYVLPELQADILEKMTTRETAKGVIDSDEFKIYSDPLKQYILQKHYTLL